MIEIGALALILGAYALVAVLPLNIAIKIMGGETTMMKTAIVHVIASLAIFGLNLIMPYNIGWLSYFLIIAIYKYAFDMGWFRALLAWILSGVILIVIVLVVAFFVLGGFDAVMQMIPFTVSV